MKDTLPLQPPISAYFAARQPSAIRLAQTEFIKRTDHVQAINTAIGNVSLPMYPAMQNRMFMLNASASPFRDGVAKYSETVGTQETRAAFLNVLASSGFATENIHVQITDGGSQAMELMLLGTCGNAGSHDQPLLLIDAAYSNYISLAARVGRPTVSVARMLGDNGHFTLPNFAEIEAVIEKEKPGALLVIPYDNPTGQFYSQEMMNYFARLCVKHNMWLVSDEAYRELFYTKDTVSSIWGVTEEKVPGITGRRISIESASKVWNACGLRIGALMTDNAFFHQQAVAENTANLCSNVIGQYIFGALAHESHDDLQKWYAQQRAYYHDMSRHFTDHIRSEIPGLIVSEPEAALYSVIDVKNIVKPDFDASAFVLYCATKGKVSVHGEDWTLLVAPMAGFYNVRNGLPNPGKTQMRLAYVETPEKMDIVPQLLKELFAQFHSLQ